MNKAFVTAISAIVLLVMAVVAWTWQSESDTEPTVADSAVDASTKPSASSTPWSKAPSDPSQPLDLQQMTPLTPSGKIQLSAAALPVLDHFLAENAGEAPEVIGERFKTALAHKLSPTGQTEAQDLMTRYATYQNAVRQAQQENPEPPTLDESMRQVLKLHQAISMREHFLGAEFHSALYGEAEAQQKHELAKQDIMSMTGISEEQREQMLRDLEKEAN